MRVHARLKNEFYFCLVLSALGFFIFSIIIIVFSTISGLIVSNIKLFAFNYIIQFILSGITFFLILLFLLLIFKNSIILEILKIKELNKNS